MSPGPTVIGTIWFGCPVLASELGIFAIVNLSLRHTVIGMTVISGVPHGLGESGMRLHSGVRASAEPVVPNLAAGTGVIGGPVLASAACRTSRPGKAVQDQTGAAASSVDDTIGGRRAMARGTAAG
jgi:hypothetical protein